MAKTLELLFATLQGKTAVLSIDDPKEPVDMAKVKQAMDQIITLNVFTSRTGDYISKKGARVVERNVDDYEMN
ncbi:DUF2922 domain-containing protein [Bacillus sp. MUM 13]|uniref:DUF2922 domain-containing protein n=1 Tax=Bacillus sp. MUM 13 TaxID=1678001 RepID=UPI0008F5A7B1|nr:DUF2922 domain-containing protein [Bacillus sp. MUM 13]OIK14521.1 hypothetical protein BIV59_03025 [Bacillus sp. MUM 13]